MCEMPKRLGKSAGRRVCWVLFQHLLNGRPLSRAEWREFSLAWKVIEDARCMECPTRGRRCDLCRVRYARDMDALWRRVRRAARGGPSSMMVEV
jgi:hypothetical protein